jgi:hypothetical protein
MSLDKTARRKEKIRQQNRLRRNQGQDSLGEPGPWYPIASPFLFRPDFFPGLLAANPPADKTFIGQPLPAKG